MRVQLVAFLVILSGCGGEKQKLQSHQDQAPLAQEKTERSNNAVKEDARFVYISGVKKQVNSPLKGVVSVNSPKIRRGATVKKGELLLLFDNTAAFLEIRTAKKQLKTDLEYLQPNIPARDSATFHDFLTRLNPNAILPKFPRFSLETLNLLDQNRLLDHYDAIASEEVAMSNYFVFAPVSGKVTSVPARDTVGLRERLFVIRSDRYTTSEKISGEEGQMVKLSDENGKIHPATIVRQLNNSTLLSGKLNEGRYQVAQ